MDTEVDTRNLAEHILHQEQDDINKGTDSEIIDHKEHDVAPTPNVENDEETTELTTVSIRPQTSNKNRTKNFGSMLKIAESFNRELNNEIQSTYYDEQGIIPIVLLQIELDRRKAKIKLFVKLIVYILFFIIYLAMLLNQRREWEGYLLTTAIQRELVQQTIVNEQGKSLSFEDISNVEDFWSWLEKVYVHRLYDPHWYSSINDSYAPNLWHTLGFQTKAIGGFRLAQTRGVADKGGYCYDSIFNHFLDHCYSEQESRDDMKCNGRLNCSYIQTADAYQYDCDDFGLCGFYQDFAFNESVEAQTHVIEQLEQLKYNRWIDEHTRSVQILTNFYNRNYKRWIHAQFEVHIDLAGKVEEHEDMKILRIELYRWDLADIVGVILEVSFVLFVFGYLIFHVKLISKYMKNDGWNGFIRNAKTHWFGWVSVVNNCVIIVIWLAYILNDNRNQLVRMGEAGDDEVWTTYISLQELSDIDDIYVAFNVINLMMITINGIQYFQVTEPGEAIYIALAEALPMIISYIPMYLMCICGFALAGQLLFGFTNETFSTFWNAMYVVVQMNFASYPDTQHLWNTAGLLGKIYILALFFVFIPFLINIFLAIVINSWDEFFELRNALASVQQFGIRPIAFSQTVHGWWKKLPLGQVSNAIDNVQSDEIGFDEFVTILESIEDITIENKETILDFFWYDRHKPSDEEMDGQADDVNELEADEQNTINSNAVMLKQLFSKKGNRSRKNLNVDVMHTIRAVGQHQRSKPERKGD
eukprot:608953_1